MIYIGVDPGEHGGIGIVCDDSVMAIPMPKTEKELWDFLKPFGIPDLRPIDYLPQSYAVLEKVGGYIAKDMGRAGMGSSMFVFGKNYGIALMSLVASGIPFDQVHSRTWQKSFFSAKIKGEKYHDRKKRLKEKAQELFPKLKVTLSTADALLLARYAQLTYNNVEK